MRRALEGAAVAGVGEGVERCQVVSTRLHGKGYERALPGACSPWDWALAPHGWGPPTCTDFGDAEVGHRVVLGWFQL